MQTPKSRPGSLDVRQRQSGVTPLTARKLRTLGSDSDATLSPNPVIKKERSPRLVDRRSPRSPAIEKKRPNRVSELESQLAQLQEELKKAKEQLTSSESSKRMAQQEAQETKKQLAATSAELELTQQQLNSFSDSEESRVQELRKISKDRDRVWQSELEALQKQHSLDSSSLSSAMNEIQRLKIQLERISESEAKQARHAESAHAEIQSLRVELTKTLDHANFLKNQLNNCRESEAETLEEVSRAQMELEVLKSSQESYKSLATELEQTQNQVFALEELVASLKADLANARKLSANPSEIEAAELHELKHESSQLRALLEAAERRYQDEYLQSTLEIRSAYELVDRTKLESRQIEAELEAKVKIYEAEAEELKIKLMEKENEFPKSGDTFNGRELNESESVLEEMKLSLLEKEMRLNCITEENEKLKHELEKEMGRSKAIDEAEGAEREALMKLGFLREEADKSCRKTERVTEQLDAAQAANSEMEAELRRLKVQSDQWRKAAEAATAMLSVENNGKHVERNGSFDYYTVGGKLDHVTYPEDMDDEASKKKNGNVLRKIGVLLKKK